MPSAKGRANSDLAQRIDRVMDYLRGNLDRQVKLKELAKVACFSEFHFHRIFGEVSGETLNNFTTGFVLKGLLVFSICKELFDATNTIFRRARKKKERLL